MTQNTVYLDAVTLVAPGVETSDQLKEALSNPSFTGFPSDWKPKPDSIASRMYRRFSPQTLLAFLVAERIATELSSDAAWVFGSAFGEGETLKVILDALSTPHMAIRPTRFQNSVHNAASGQWTIARGTRNDATSICGGDCTAGSSLLKALMQVQLETRPVGVVLFDSPLPYPLSVSHKLTVPAGAGFAFSPIKNPASLARIEYALCDATCTLAKSRFAQVAEATGNPVFATLPFYECISEKVDRDILISLNGGLSLRLKVFVS